MIHIISGNGKGKTSAAVGLAVRAAGAGLKVAFFQFLKDGRSSEIAVLKAIDGISVRCCEECRKFTYEMDESEKKAVIKSQRVMMNEAAALLREQTVDMLVLDEFFAAYNTGFIDREAADSLVFGCPDNVELVLTGREPAEKFCKAADYHSEIRSLKNPYDKGTQARRGIEY